MNDHVTKPIDPDDLAAALVRWVKPRAPAQAKMPSAVADNGAADDLPVSLPPFDIAAALTRINGNRELLKNLIATFNAEFDQTTPELTRLVGTGDIEAAERIAHTLKSAAAMLGLREVTEAARTIEESARHADSDNLPAMIGALDAALAPALAAAATLRR